MHSKRVFLYAAAAAAAIVFYLKYGSQLFGNNKNHFTVHGVHMFLRLKCWKGKAMKTCFVCTVAD